jgi:trimethylamine--corrinoid protein Co-methyltransferase
MLLNDAQIDRIEAEVLRLLAEVGLAVMNDEIAGLMRALGCTDGPRRRLRIPVETAREVIAARIRINGETRKDAHTQPPIPCPEGPVLNYAFSPGPTHFFDFERWETIGLTDEIADDMIRMADATPEVGGVHPLWTPSPEPEISSVVQLVRCLKLSRKTTGLDAIYPRQMKYMVEIGEILTGQPGSSRYVGGSPCITPPLILGDRMAEEILQRRDCRVQRYSVITMTMVGVSSPVTRLGTVITGAAEVLGGMVATHAVDPEAAIEGGAFIACTDLRGDQMTMAAPEMAWINAAISELFERRWGGNVSVGTQFSPSAKVPGLQAVYENYFLACAVARLSGVDPHYYGRGMINNGGTGSPEQLMLDIEVLAAHRASEMPPAFDEKSLAIDAIHEVLRDDGRFLDHDHTLRHWRERWIPRLFRWDALGPQSPHGDGSERHILGMAHEMWRANLSRYQPPDWPDETIRALDNVERRARRDLTGSGVLS